MIKRTPQELADFFGCYVVQASKYEGSSFRCSAEKPKLSPDGERWEMKSWIDIPDELIEIPENHIWTQPYSAVKPVLDNKVLSYSNESAIPDNKDHSSEDRALKIIPGKTPGEMQSEKEANAKLTARWIEGGYGQMLAFRGNGTIEFGTAKKMLKAYADQAIDTFAEKALVEGQGAVILEVRIVPQIPASEKP